LVSGQGAIVRQFQVLFGGRALATAGDAELLERFLNRHDNESASIAFEALLHRHGPMVLRVCRSILRNDNDVDDAFQATFLVLIKRASSVRQRDSAASWLYGVALRVASAARVASARRRVFERRGAEIAAQTRSASTTPWEATEVRALLSEELERLPERFRATVVLCHLQGLTHEEAAHLLHLPVGTVRSRLSRAREKLKERLARRGLAPSEPAALLAIAPLALPATLIQSTTHAALKVAAGEALSAGVVPATVAALTKGVLRTMVITKFKVAVASLCVLGATVAAGAQISRSTFVGGTSPASVSASRVSAELLTSGDKSDTQQNQKRTASADDSSQSVATTDDPCPGSYECPIHRAAVAMAIGLRATAHKMSVGFTH
jgi:RNA polymerase sigma factor (sigma-70 family)